VHVDAGDNALLRNVDDGAGVDVVAVECADDEGVDRKKDEGGVDQDLVRVAWIRYSQFSVLVLIPNRVDAVGVARNRANSLQLCDGHTGKGYQNAQVAGEGKQAILCQGAADGTSYGDVSEDGEWVVDEVAEGAYAELCRVFNVCLVEEDVAHENTGIFRVLWHLARPCRDRQSLRMRVKNYFGVKTTFM